MKTQKKEIAYLGKMTWVDAIEKADSLGMLIPNVSMMNKIYNILKKDDENAKRLDFQTSTTYRLNFKRILHPIPKDWLNEGEEFENQHTTDRDIKRLAYAISPDMTEDDIYFGNYFLTDKSNQ